MYETRYAERLSRKKCIVTLLSPRKFGSDSELGKVEIDLHVLATGPAEQRLAMRDGGSSIGTLQCHIAMQQVSSVEVNVTSVEVDGIVGDASDVYLEMAYTATLAATVNTKGRKGPRWEHLDLLYCDATMEGLLANGLHFWVKRRRTLASDDVLAEAEVPFTPNITKWGNGLPCSFSVALEGPGVERGRLAGSFHFKSLPEYAQMVAGYHDETGCHQARLLSDFVVHLPKCAVDGDAARQLQARRSGSPGAAASSASPAAAPSPSAASRPSAASLASSGAAGAVPASGGAGRDSGHGGARSEDAGVPERSSAADPPPLATGADVDVARIGAGLLAQTLGTAQRPSESRSRALDVALPEPWQAFVADDGRLYFKNRRHRYTVWKLPTKRTYDITVASEGSLGLELARVPGQRIGALITEVKAGGKLASTGVVKAGHIITAAQSTNLPFEDIVEVVTRAARPIKLTFYNPDAVDPGLAAHVMATHSHGGAARGAYPPPSPVAAGRSPHGGAHYPAHSPVHAGGHPGAHGGGPAPGWQTVVDPSSGRPFYREVATGRTSWTWPPTF